MKRVILALGVLLSIQSIAQSNVKNPFTFFKGYKVDTAALKISREKDLGTSYWMNTPAMEDFIVTMFNRGLQEGDFYTGFTTGLMAGDFNNDGYIDVFDPGSTNPPSPSDGGLRSTGIYSKSVFLIWDTASSKFKEKFLFNDKSINHVGVNIIKTFPVYLNDDNYIDLILIDNTEGYDTILKNNPTMDIPAQPLRIALSDGKGNYDIIPFIGDLQTLNPVFTMSGASLGDLNGDNIPDLVINYGLVMKIFWGIKSYPYFDVKNPNLPIFSRDKNQNTYPNNNGFDETCYNCGINQIGSVVADVNSDGYNDIIITTAENNYDSSNVLRVLFNKGQGRFNESSVYELPHHEDTLSSLVFRSTDYIVDDINGDGLKDIITMSDVPFKGWYIYIYMQQNNGTFILNKNLVEYTKNLTRKGWKPRLKYFDINGDGKKDISYTNESSSLNNIWSDSTNEMYSKSVFIRTGDKFIEDDYYKYDLYAKTLAKYIDYYPFDDFCKFTSLPNITPEKDANYYYICPGDSIKISLLTKNSGDTFSWLIDEKIDSTSTALNNITITKTSTLKVIRVDSLGCEVNRIISFTLPSITPNQPPIIKDTVICQFTTPFSLSPFVIEAPDYGLKWFDQDPLAISGSNTPSIVNTNDSGNRKYYVSMYGKVFDNAGNFIYNTCYGPRNAITVKIIPAPANPIVRDTAYCNNISADTLKAVSLSGHSLNWYGNNATGGTASNLGSKPNTSTVGSLNYYVSQINNTTSCESPRAKIGVNINPLPIAPVVRDTAYCNNVSADTIRVTATTGSSLLWYGTNATGGTSSNTAIKPSTASVGTANYYLSQIITATGCEGLRSKIAVTIKPIPSAPSLTRDTANYLLSGASGTTWYKDGVAITDTTQKYKPTAPGSYTAKTTTNGCTSVLSAAYYYLVTDIINLSKDEYIKLAPNPFVNQLNFDFVVKGYQKLNIEVFDIATGTKVASQLNITAGSRIALGQLSGGTYIIRVTSNDQKIVQQFKVVKM